MNAAIESIIATANLLSGPPPRYVTEQTLSFSDITGISGADLAIESTPPIPTPVELPPFIPVPQELTVPPPVEDSSEPCLCGNCNSGMDVEAGEGTSVGRRGHREQWCETCVDEETFECPNCEERLNLDEQSTVRGTDNIVCTNCADEYTHCERCHEPCVDYILTPVLGRGSVCENCYTNSGMYSRCVECEYVFRCGDYEGERCSHCAEEREESEGRSPILSYSTRVDTTPEGKGPIWFGIELEVEVKSGFDVNEMATECKGLLGDFVIIKSDGSLNNGFEIVTRPASLDVHRTRWEKFMEKRPRGIRSWETTTCGMHVHLTRRGRYEAAIMTDLTVAKIVMFVNSPRNKSFIVDIAGRDADRWAKMQDKESLPKALRAIERYEAVNLLNKKTIEFRIFRGTLSYGGFMKNLEFTEAVKDFCGQAGRSLAECQSLTAFKDFVSANKKGYPFLYRFINTK